jgi:hypothetical protein
LNVNERALKSVHVGERCNGVERKRRDLKKGIQESYQRALSEIDRYTHLHMLVGECIPWGKNRMAVRESPTLKSARVDASYIEVTRTLPR